MIDLTFFENIILSADANATKYFSDQTGNYTVWIPIKPVRTSSDDEPDDLYFDVQVERYTKIDPDPIVAAIEEKLLAARIQFEYLIDAEKESKYVRHIFTCQVR